MYDDITPENMRKISQKNADERIMKQKEIAKNLLSQCLIKIQDAAESGFFSVWIENNDSDNGFDKAYPYVVLEELVNLLLEKNFKARINHPPYNLNISWYE